MIKAFLRARWMVWLSLLILLVASLLANWLINASLEVALNSWFFALIPLLVIRRLRFLAVSPRMVAAPRRCYTACG